MLGAHIDKIPAADDPISTLKYLYSSLEAKLCKAESVYKS